LTRLWGLGGGGRIAAKVTNHLNNHFISIADLIATPDAKHHPVVVAIFESF